PDERVAVRIVDLLADLAGAQIALVARAGVPCVAKLKPAAADVGGAGLPEIDRNRAVRRRHFERVDVTRVALDVTFRVTVAIVALRPRASPFHLFVVVAEVVQVLLHVLAVLLSLEADHVNPAAAAGVVTHAFAATPGRDLLFRECFRLFILAQKRRQYLVLAEEALDLCP